MRERDRERDWDWERERESATNNEWNWNLWIKLSLVVLNKKCDFFGLPLIASGLTMSNFGPYFGH